MKQVVCKPDVAGIRGLADAILLTSYLFEYCANRAGRDSLTVWHAPIGHVGSILSSHTVGVAFTQKRRLESA